LGWDLFDARGKPDRERYPVGQQHGSFSSIRLHADKAATLSQVVVIFMDGERFIAPAPSSMGAGQ
jgi:hypothetical protein